MNLFSRLSELLDLDVSSGVEEDLEVALDRILAEMELTIAEAKRYAATAIASERLLAWELEQTNRAVDRWRSAARQALSSGDGVSARKAVLRKRKLEASASRLSRQHATARQTSEELKTSLCNLEMRLAEATGKHRVMLCWERVALARINFGRRLRSAMNGSETVAECIGRLEAELDAVQAELWAHAGGNGPPRQLDPDSRALEIEQQIDKELETLRRNVGS